MEFNRRKYKETLNLVKENNLNTICLEANCPNRYKCFSNSTATFMILGNICTRNCGYCNVKHGKPKEVDENEVERIVDAVKILKLDYVVITSVTRDDLEDGGARQFVAVIEELKRIGCAVEVLIPDFLGKIDSLKKVIETEPDVINHNIEVVKSLFPKLRKQGDYDRSVEVLRQINMSGVKSGLMVGFGESKEEVIECMRDLKSAGVEMLTIGQYLQPSSEHAEVVKYYSDEEFVEFGKIAKEMGFNVASGKLVRSSYNAREMAGY